MRQSNYDDESLGNSASFYYHHKNLNVGDYLIDDRTENGAGQFRGKHIHFNSEEFPDWNCVCEYLLGDNSVT